MTIHRLSGQALITSAALLSLLMLWGSGCATWKANQARQRYILDQTALHDYAAPCEKVFPTARQLLFEQGYAVKSVDTTNLTIETEWGQVAGSASNNNGVPREQRYLLQGKRPSPETCSVALTLAIADSNGNTTRRDLDLEWTLLQRVDPESARAIEANADDIYRANGGR